MSVVSVKKPDEGITQVKFSDGSKFDFHNMWLRDSCMDSQHRTAAGERHLPAAPFIEKLRPTLPNMDAQVNQNGDLSVAWGEGSIGTSVIDAAWLRAYADKVGRASSLSLQDPDPAQGCHHHLLNWLGLVGEGEAVKDDLTLFKNDGRFDMPRISYADAMSSPTSLWDKLADPGVAIISDMPEDVHKDGSVLQRFAREAFGGLQKHPLRQAEHWTISTEDEVQMEDALFDEVDGRGSQNSYNTDQQLANHTDQVLYGTPGVLLMFHCAFGQGGNSITDGFAAAQALRERHPEKFQILTQYGLNLGRRLDYYSAGRMNFNVCNPVLKTDAAGNMTRVTYNEIYRVPLTIPFADYLMFYDALETFYGMIHSEEFQQHLVVREHELLVMNNWRVMHGRAGLKGKARVILGGTVARDVLASKVREHFKVEYAVPDALETGMDVGLYQRYNAFANSEAKQSINSGPADEDTGVFLRSDAPLNRSFAQ